MSKHTPGPWICHSGMVWTDGPEVWPKGDDDGIPIARMDREPGNGTTPTERDANARLIAAAPDLLEACELAKNELGDLMRHGREGERAQAKYAWETLTAAIAKAEEK